MIGLKMLHTVHLTKYADHIISLKLHGILFHMFYTVVISQHLILSSGFRKESSDNPSSNRH